jgi:hypothetical protein
LGGEDEACRKAFNAHSHARSIGRELCTFNLLKGGSRVARAAASCYGRGLNTAHHLTVFSPTSSRVSICGGKRRERIMEMPPLHTRCHEPDIYTAMTRGKAEIALWPRKFRTLRSTFCAIQIELFPFRYPITSATEYFGGIDTSI